MVSLREGRLVDEAKIAEERTSTEFQRAATSFRHTISDEPDARFRPEPGRYHVYLSHACPWAHRVLVVLQLKRLEGIISHSFVGAINGEFGWAFDDFEDPLHGLRFVYQLYQLADARYTGRVTVPVLFDRRLNTIVNNESSEIIRMFNTTFNRFIAERTDLDQAERDAAVRLDLYPEALRGDIDRINDFVYPRINNGVYRCGFAGNQAAYDTAFDELFGALDHLDDLLSHQPYLTGHTCTEADWRLFTTLVRFDAVYFTHFKCNKKMLHQYPNLTRLLRRLLSVPGIRDTIDMHIIKRHYFASHISLNPKRIVARGPDPILSLEQVDEPAEPSGGTVPSLDLSQVKPKANWGHRHVLKWGAAGVLSSTAFFFLGAWLGSRANFRR